MQELKNNDEECRGSAAQSEEILDILQQLPNQYHWALSDPSILFSIYNQKPLIRQGRGYYLGILINIVQRLEMAWPLISLVGMVELCKLLLQQHLLSRNNRRDSGDFPSHFFVGFDVGKEEELFSYYSEKQDDEVARVHQYKLETFAVWSRVGVVQGFRSLISSIAIARKAVASLPPELAFRQGDFHTHIASKIGYYAYMRAWFEKISNQAGHGLQEVAFSCQNTAVFAAVDARIRAVYFSHGMITRCELLPEFKSVSALTTDEAAFIRKRLPKADVTVYSSSRRVLKPIQLTRKILITSCPIGGNANYMLNIVPFLHWAKTKNLPVRVRLHPCEDITYFWSKYEDAGLVSVENKGSDFLDAVYDLKPRLLFSWVSTTLADVLPNGIIPMTACLDDDPFVAELVYPIFQRCLRLTDEVDEVERLLNDDEYYSSILSRLQSELTQTTKKPPFTS